MSFARKTLALINKDDVESISTSSSSTTISAIQPVTNDSNIRMFLLNRGHQTNNNSRRPKLTIKAKQKLTTNRKISKQQLPRKVTKLKLKPLRLKKTKQKRFRSSNKGKQQHTRQKRTRLSTKRGKSHSPISKRRRNRTVIPSSHQQQQYRLKVTTIDKTQLAQNRKKSTMELHRLHHKMKKSRGNSSIQAGRQQRFNSLSKPQTYSPQSIQTSEVKQHNFEKRDRTTSLMALQALAEKIAIYKAKYGNIETRHSSIVAPPKPHKKQKQRK